MFIIKDCILWCFENFFSRCFYGAHCVHGRASQLYIGHLWARPVTVNMHDIYVHYWLQVAARFILILTTAVGIIPSILEYLSINMVLEDATYDMNHCCSVSIPFRHEQNAITYRKYMETMDYVSLGRGVSWKGVTYPMKFKTANLQRNGAG